VKKRDNYMICYSLGIYKSLKRESQSDNKIGLRKTIENKVIQIFLYLYKSVNIRYRFIKIVKIVFYW
jgi:hypothetical protein